MRSRLSRNEVVRSFIDAINSIPTARRSHARRDPFGVMSLADLISLSAVL
jgi:hypothetical protein